MRKCDELCAEYYGIPDLSMGLFCRWQRLDNLQGTVSIDRRVVNRLPPRDRNVAMVFQNCVLFPHMTVQQNMAFGLKLRKTPRSEIRRRVGRAAEVLGIEGLLARRPGELSGGERQRVAAARALVNGAGLLLCDEPTGNLDRETGANLVGLLIELAAQDGVIVLMVTHNEPQAARFERCLLLRDGGLQPHEPASAEVQP